MARRSSGRSAPRRAPVRNPPHSARQAPPPAPAQSRRSSFLGTIAEGVAFGTGSAMAHRAVDAIMGPRTVQHETVVSEAAASAAPMGNAAGSDSCNDHSKAFQDVCFSAIFLDYLLLLPYILFPYDNGNLMILLVHFNFPLKSHPTPQHQ
ncbi:hypothetical protein GUJ93_ZPchr0003g17658 [Zizania palustris]|uniref:Uncharacterized protein n=1 Tax=Zizania palustris TaxID=103762 RepID=A0A8J5RXK1_ZIZPA|nr:hypothetical protein GUJ93_ZPchr0003g17658 [Zizania palustris]